MTPADVSPDTRRHVSEVILGIVADREASENLMRTLGAQGEAIFAHREATAELRTLATRWSES